MPHLSSRHIWGHFFLKLIVGLCLKTFIIYFLWDSLCQGGSGFSVWSWTVLALKLEISHADSSVLVVFEQWNSGSNLSISLINEQTFSPVLSMRIVSGLLGLWSNILMQTTWENLNFASTHELSVLYQQKSCIPMGPPGGLGSQSNRLYHLYCS